MAAAGTFHGAAWGFAVNLGAVRTPVATARPVVVVVEAGDEPIAEVREGTTAQQPAAPTTTARMAETGKRRMSRQRLAGS